MGALAVEPLLDVAGAMRARTGLGVSLALSGPIPVDPESTGLTDRRCGRIRALRAPNPIPSPATAASTRRSRMPATRLQDAVIGLAQSWAFGAGAVMHRMRQLTGELSKLRVEVELPCTPIHGDYKLGNAGRELSDGSWATFDLDFARVRERLYDVAASLHHVAQGGELLEPNRCSTPTKARPEPLTRDEHRWLPGALALIPLHWAATAGLVGDGIREAESAVTAAEAWWSRRAELSS